jgi:hypothetical protein
MFYFNYCGQSYLKFVAVATITTENLFRIWDQKAWEPIHKTMLPERGDYVEK